jgi:Uma2 family endonuclease
MVATQPPRSTPPEAIEVPKPFTLEDFMQNPPQDMEWVDGELIEKTGMTIRHAIVQGRLLTFWNNYAASSGQSGQALVEAPCRTRKQGRRPDVAYMTLELMVQFGRTAALPQSYPLIAEVASPDDSAEGLFAKAIEYLESGCEEVWLIFPEAQLVMVKTQEQAWQLFTPGQTIRTQKVLKEFEIAIDTLLN